MTNLSEKQNEHFRVKHESTSNTFLILQLDEFDRIVDDMRIDYDEILDLINILTEFTKFH